MAGWTKEDVRFDSHGAQCGAWLFKPDGVEQPPVVVLCHGLGATRERRLDAFAERFAAAGIAAFAITYRHFGDSEGEPRQLLDIAEQHEDIAAALAYVRGRADLDKSRVALWGSSFGGGHVIAMGARDGRLKAVVAQCPFTDGLASGFTLGPVSTLKVTALAIADAIGSLLGRPPRYAGLAGKRGEAALMTAPDVVAGQMRLQEGLTDYDNRVAARVALKIMLYRPGTKLKQIACPVLVCVCEADTVAPAKAALGFAKGLANVQVKTYPIGHFDIYFDAAFEQVVADETAFLQQQLGVAG